MSDRFDDLTRAMAVPRTRRGVLKILGGTAVAATAATVLKPFRSDGFIGACTGPTNVGPSPCAAGTTPCGPCCCQKGIACVDASSGVCGCPAGTTPCGSACCQKGTACANPSTSTCATAAASCTQGQPCGKTCCAATGQVCVSGTCTNCVGSGQTCAAGDTCCTAGQACISDVCQSASCGGKDAFCRADSDCCAPVCELGIPNKCGGVGIGHTCTSSSQCNGAPIVCQGGVCCLPTGTGCNPSFPGNCCSGVCTGGFCT